MSVAQDTPRRHRAAASSVGVAACVILLAGCGEPGRSGSGESSRARTILIGIDGATWDFIDPMMADGELPHFRALLERGARGPLIALPPLSSPVVWTTIATGTFPRSHEILGFTYPFSGGPGRPVSSDLRQDPAIWNVASAHGRRVGVIGYFVSHPPEEVDGFMVSDRLVHRVPDATFPANLQADADRIVDEVHDEPRLLARFLPWDYRPEAALDESDPFHQVSRIVRVRMDGVVYRDESFRRVALDLVREPTDFFACYFRIVDHACHTTWLYFDDSAFDEPADPEEKELLGGIIHEAYRYMDEVLGAILAEVGDDVNLVVVSDHGFGPATGDYRVGVGEGVRLSGSHRNDGIFLAAGPDVRPGRVEGLTTIDVAPILATLVGLPLAADLPGRVPEELFRPDYFADHPRAVVPTWRAGWSAGGAAQVPLGAELEMLEELEALGYIDGFEGELPERPPSELDFWSVSQGNRELALTGELTYHLLRESVPDAEALLALTAERDPAAREVLPERARKALAAIEESLDVAPDSLVDPAFLEAVGIAD